MGNDILQKIEKSAKPDFGDILSKSLELGKKVWQDALVHALIVFVFAIPFLLLIYIPFFPIYMDLINNAGDPYYTPDFMYSGYSVMWWVGYVVGVLVLSFLMQIVSMAVTSHFYKVCRKKDLNTSEEVGGYFNELKGNFSKLLMLSLSTFGIAMLAVLLCYLPIFYVMVPLQLFIPIFAFNKNLNASEIIKASFKLGNKYWIIAFGLIWLSSLIAQLGIIFCGVGILVTAYFVHLTMYYFYKDTIGFEDSAALISE